ncbi:MAG: glycosyltransferase [Candidatus Binatia bacterium]
MLPVHSALDRVEWMRERVDALCSAGAHGSLYVFLQEPPSAALADVLRSVTTGRRLLPNVIAPEAALSANVHLGLLERAGVRVIYLTLRGSSAVVHDERAGKPGSWRRTLLLLITAPQSLQRLRFGTHWTLSPQTSEELPLLFRVVRKLGDRELLFWDAGSGGIDGVGLEPLAALRALDFAVTTAQKLGVRIRPVGFERTRGVVAPSAQRPCVATSAIIGLLRDGIRLPSAEAGLLASNESAAAIAEPAPNGHAVAQLSFELAAGGRPFLDLPACLGGLPPDDSATPGGIRVDACKQCPLERQCGGLASTLIDISGLREEIRPPRHWLGMPKNSRVLVMCPVVTDEVYGATFFSLARWLVRLGARVDLISPRGSYGDIAPTFGVRQPVGEPEGAASEVEKFVVDGPADRYDLILAPYLRTARLLLHNPHLRDDTRVVATDFHMLGGMDGWVEDFCAPGRRPEEGGWWPSDRVVLCSAFPGYARLYTRYGVPMRQIIWQPFALDPGSFSSDLPVTEGTSIISGGNHRRDVATLLAAAARLGSRVHSIDLFAEEEVRQAPPQIHFHGVVVTSVFCRAVSRSRFMVVPLLEDPYNAAGITAMTTAIMCGRPIVATATPASGDYVIDGVNGLLVPPGDAPAMADAIERLDNDTALLMRLAAGARDTASQMTTERWAHTLLHGNHAYEVNHWIWSKWRHRSFAPAHTAAQLR